MIDARLKQHLPPSQKASLIGGHFRAFRSDPTNFLARQAKLGDISYLRMGHIPTFFLNHPDLVRDVLIVNARKFHKGRALKRAKTLLGEGLLTSEGELHLHQRRMIQPAFHRQRIAEYAKVMTYFADRTMAGWTDGEILDIDKEMMRLTLRIVGKTLFDADVESETDEIGNAMTTFTKLFNFLLLPFSELLQKLPLPQNMRFNRARNDLDSLVYRIIRERRLSNEDRGDLLSMLLLARDEEDGSAMSDKQIRDETLTLFLAGHETTANAMTFTWHLLSQNPDCEAKLHEEIDRVLGSRPPAFEDLPNLKYAEAVFAESIRLYPPAWAIGRLSIIEHELQGYDIPIGALILMSPYIMHRDPRFWDAPESFEPERWERVDIRDAGQRNIYIPFGGGIRRCIGEGFAWAEGILLLASIAQRWQLRELPDQKFGLSPMITLRPKYGMKMIAIKR